MSSTSLTGDVAGGIDAGRQLIEQAAHATIPVLQPLELRKQGHRSFTVEAAWLLGRQKRNRPANPFKILGRKGTGVPREPEAIHAGQCSSSPPLLLAVRPPPVRLRTHDLAVGSLEPSTQVLVFSAELA